MVMWGLLGLVVGFTGGVLVLLWPWGPGWFEAAGTWVAALVAMSAVILAVLAFRSEEFARRLDRTRAERDERTKLQQAADLVMCVARVATVDQQMADEISVRTTNGSRYMVTDLTCYIPQLGDGQIKLADVLPPDDEAFQPIQVAEAFRVTGDNHELYESAKFRFSLGGATWLGRYAQPAERLDV
jgi:HAMP domain-containing protein